MTGSTGPPGLRPDAQSAITVQHSMTKTGRHATTPGPWRAPNLSLMDRVWPCARWTTPSPCGKGLTAEAVVYVWRAAL
jgi:hypothetical protein